MSTKQFEAYFRWRNTAGELQDCFVIFEAKSKADAKRLSISHAEQHQITFCSIDSVSDKPAPTEIQLKLNTALNT